MSAESIPDLLDRMRTAITNLEPQHLAGFEQAFAKLADTLPDVGIPRPSERDLHAMVAAYMMYRSFILQSADRELGALGRPIVEPLVEQAGQQFLMMLGATPRPMPDHPDGPHDPDPNQE